MIESKIPLPTDNLYKFMALAGIILMLLVFIPVYRVHSLTTEAMEITGEIAALDIECEYLMEKVSQLELEHTILKTKKEKFLIDIKVIEADGIKSESDFSDKKNKYVSENLGDIITGDEEISQKGNLIRELSKELKVLLADSKNKNEIVIYKYKINDRMLTTGGILAFGGLFLASCGFVLWYVKLQRYQDKIVKNQAEKHQMNENRQEETEEKSTEDSNDS